MGLMRWLRKAPEAQPAGGAGAAERSVAGRLGGERADALLRRVEWTSLRRLDGVLQGDVRSLARGMGLDLADLRAYQPHDDVRHIDWHATARLQQTHVRVFNEERAVAVWLLIDASASLDFGASARNKGDLLREAVALLGAWLGRHGNRVGAFILGAGGRGGTVQRVAARGGRAPLLALLQRLDERSKPATAQVAAQSAIAGRTRLADLLQAAQAQLRQRSTVFVLSDFISTPGWETALGQLAQRHEVLALHLSDPLEQRLPDWGWLPMRDLETGEQLLVDTEDAGFRQRYAALAAAQAQSVRTGLARAGVDALALSTEEDLLAALLRFARLRRLRGRNGAGARAPGPVLQAGQATRNWSERGPGPRPIPQPPPPTLGGQR